MAEHADGRWASGVSGQAFVGADIGGFAGNSNAELFLRWMQYGALTPFCRNHSEIGNVDQYAWSWGEVVEDLVREAIRLRYRLLPYLYAAFLTRLRDRRAGAAAAGLRPSGRPDGPRPRRPVPVRSGPAGRAGARSPGRPHGRSTSPAGTGTTGTPASRYGGPAGSSRADTPMDRIPVFARGGAVIPMWPDAPALDRRLPPGGHRAAPVRTRGGRHATLDPAGGRRRHLRGRGAALPHSSSPCEDGRELRADSTATATRVRPRGLPPGHPRRGRHRSASTASTFLPATTGSSSPTPATAWWSDSTSDAAGRRTGVGLSPRVSVAAGARPARSGAARASRAVR